MCKNKNTPVVSDVSRGGIKKSTLKGEVVLIEKKGDEDKMKYRGSDIYLLFTFFQKEGFSFIESLRFLCDLAARGAESMGSDLVKEITQSSAAGYSSGHHDVMSAFLKCESLSPSFIRTIGEIAEREDTPLTFFSKEELKSLSSMLIQHSKKESDTESTEEGTQQERTVAFPVKKITGISGIFAYPPLDESCLPPQEGRDDGARAKATGGPNRTYTLFGLLDNPVVVDRMTRDQAVRTIRDIGDGDSIFECATVSFDDNTGFHYPEGGSA